jgi:GTPase SAR1 family protein
MGVDGIILMYDLTDDMTKNNVMTRWIPDIKRLLLSSNLHDIPLAVVGNKSDKIDMNMVDVIDRQNILIANQGPPKLDFSLIYKLYDAHRFGPVKRFHISVKADIKLMEPLQWIVHCVLSGYLPPTIKRTAKIPQIIMCNK